MPRKTKEQKELENEELSTVNTTSTVRKTSSSTKKTSSKSTTKKTEKNISDKNVAESENPKKDSTSKKSNTATSRKVATKTSTKSVATDSTRTKKATSKKRSTEKKSVAKTSKTEKTVSEKKLAKKTVTKPTVSTEKSNSKKSDIVEYYDLPYRYNQTVVKLLAQTPTNLFVYWDISDTDREKFKKQYGYDFFEKTRPILIVHNDTMNYSFEVEINDFANCWYLHVNDSNCDYRIELGRKPVIGYVQNWQPSEEDLKDENSEINKYPSKPIDRDYFYITTSNELKAPNDHILFNKHSAKQSIQIRNIKTNEQYSKSISALYLQNNIHKIYNIYDLYKELYKEENVEDIFDLTNPSSGNPSSSNPSSGSFSSNFK